MVQQHVKPEAGNRETLFGIMNLRISDTAAANMQSGKT
jgi:hypothetical protein